jgi:hypothetical protein
MPAKSDKQYRFMAGVAHGSIPATGGLTKGKAKEFVDATPPKMRSKWSQKKKIKK